MHRPFSLLLLASGLACASSPVPRDTATTDAQALSSKTVLDLGDVMAHPPNYEWFDFRPNVKKLILAGAPETEHVAILWYTVPDGKVGLHLHAKTESVYVIDGGQTDAKGTYPKGTVYFNPPGSGHAISDSSGFFLLAYAAPPDFKNTAAIAEYTPVRIDTADPNLMQAATSEPALAAARVLPVSLDGSGGMSARFIELSSPEARYDYVGNYLLALRGNCQVGSQALAQQGLVVAKSVKPEAFALSAAPGGSCTALGVSF